MGLFSGGSSSFESSSYSGLRSPTNNAAFSHLLSRTPGDLNFQVDLLKSRAGNANPLGLGADGFLAGQREGIDVFGRNLFSNISSNYAGRGFLAPENVAGVIGSAVREASPTLMNIFGQNAMNNQAVMSDRFSQLQAALNLYPQLLGQQSTSKGRQDGANLFGGALAGALQNAMSPSTYLNTGGGGSGTGLIG